MLKDQCISVTDLRTKTKQYLDEIDQAPKYIFLNNQPIAVLLGISDYEEHFLQPQLVELSMDEVTPEMLARAKKARMSKKRDLVNLQ